MYNVSLSANFWGRWILACLSSSVSQVIHCSPWQYLFSCQHLFHGGGQPESPLLVSSAHFVWIFFKDQHIHHLHKFSRLNLLLILLHSHHHPSYMWVRTATDRARKSEFHCAVFQHEFYTGYLCRSENNPSAVTIVFLKCKSISR